MNKEQGKIPRASDEKGYIRNNGVESEPQLRRSKHISKRLKEQPWQEPLENVNLEEEDEVEEEAVAKSSFYQALSLAKKTQEIDLVQQ